jgi:hypothetical protein
MISKNGNRNDKATATTMTMAMTEADWTGHIPGFGLP